MAVAAAAAAARRPARVFIYYICDWVEGNTRTGTRSALRGPRASSAPLFLSLSLSLSLCVSLHRSRVRCILHRRTREPARQPPPPSACSQPVSVCLFAWLLCVRSRFGSLSSLQYKRLLLYNSNNTTFVVVVIVVVVVVSQPVPFTTSSTQTTS